MLPGYGFNGQNALLDFSPLNQGFDTYRKGMVANQDYKTAQSVAGEVEKKNYSGAMSNALMGDRADLAGVAMQARAADSHEKDADLKRQYMQIDRMGRIAAAAADDPNPQNQAKAHAWLVSQHPNRDKLDPMYLDPRTGLKMMAAEAGQYKTELEKKMEAAKLGLMQAQTHQAYRKDEPDIVRTMRAAGMDPRSPEGQQIILNSMKGGGPIDQAIAGMLPSGGNAMPPQQAPAQQPNSLYKPQSFEQPQGDPNIIRTTDGVAPQAGQPAEPTVKVLGRDMPVSQARNLAQAMAASPGKAELGKMIMDQIGKTEGGLGKEATNKVEEQLIARMNDLSELEDIQAGFKPEFQSLAGKLKATASSWQSFVQGGLKDPEQKQALNDFVEHRVKTTERLNNRIKIMAGTAVSGKEEERMYKANPNAGTGILDGDDPDTFQTKTETQIRMQKSAMMRYSYLKSKGASAEAIAELAKSGRIEGFARLEDIPKIYQQRGKELEGIIRQSNPNIRPDQLPGAVKQQLKREFGI